MFRRTPNRSTRSSIGKATGPVLEALKGYLTIVEAGFSHFDEKKRSRVGKKCLFQVVDVEFSVRSGRDRRRLMRFVRLMLLFADLRCRLSIYDLPLLKNILFVYEFCMMF